MMKFSWFARALLLVWVGCSCVRGARAQAAESAGERPNVVLIMLDDMGPADLRCFGSKVIETPNLDRLAARGMRFTQAYAGCSVCAPSRSALMTGKHMGRTTVRANPGGVPLRDEDVTIAEVLSDAGYACGGFGKWGLGDLDTPGVPERQGFERFFGYYHQVHAHYFYPEYLIDTGKKVPLPNDGFYRDPKRPEGPVATRKAGGGGDGEYVFSAYAIFEQMKQFIRARAGADRPFFCYAPWTIPHQRWEIPEDDPAWQRYKDEPWSLAEKSHAAYCTLADRFVGETISLLEELAIEQKTMVIFCSDNGAPNRSPILNSSGGLRGEKGQLYEGGIRTPLIICWPGKVKAGASDTPVYLPDILPTLAEVAGARAPGDADGVSLVAELLGSARLPRDRHLYWEWNGAHFGAYEPKFQAVRRGAWKLVRHDPAAPWELYDLERDRGEAANVAAGHAEVVDELSAWIEDNRQPHLPQIEPSKPKGQRWR